MKNWFNWFGSLKAYIHGVNQHQQIYHWLWIIHTLHMVIGTSNYLVIEMKQFETYCCHSLRYKVEHFLRVLIA